MRKRNAFTLLEILVVVSILTLLISLLFPAFASVRKAAQRTKCLTNMAGIAKAIRSFAAEHENRLPSSYYGSSPYGAKNPNDSWKVLNPYLRSDNFDILRCPGDQGSKPDAQSSYFEADGYSYSYMGGGAYGLGICEVVGDAVPYFEEELGNSPGPIRQEIENALRNGDISEAEIHQAADTLIARAKGWAGKSNVYITDMGGYKWRHTLKVNPRPDEDPWNYKGPFWHHDVHTTDYWSRASRKVMLLDRDAVIAEPNRGFWHYEGQIPAKANAAFVDGHAEAIDLTTTDRNKIKYYKGGTCTLHPGGTCPGVDRDHDYY